MPVMDRRRLAGLAFILLAAFICFLPLVRSGFMDWDDPSYVLSNPLIRNFSFAGLRDIFSSFHFGLYKPLVFATYSAEYHFFGLNPAVFHLTNILIHLANCGFVYALMMVISGEAAVAFVVSLLFAVHPMHVESVAWIVERKDVLYTFFFLPSLICYFRYLDKGRKMFYWASCVLLALSFLVKPMGVTMPAIMLLADYLRGRSFSKSMVYDKIVPALLSIGAAALGLFSSETGGVLFERGLSHWQNICVASYGFVHYLVKAVWPANLSILYPYPELSGGGLPFLYRAAPVAAFLAAVGVLWLVRKRKELVFGWLFFICVLAPGLQWMNVAPSVAFDHYSYVSYIGLFFMAAALGVPAYIKLQENSRARTAVFAVFLLVSGAYGAAAAERVKVWRDPVTMWTDVLSKYPDDTFALNKRGYALYEAGLPEAAISDYSRALVIKPDYQDAVINRANALRLAGRPEEALSGYARAIAIDPNIPGVYNNIGNIHLAAGRYNEAEAAYRKALALDPRLAMSVYGLGAVFMKTGRDDAALELMLRAAALIPAFPQANHDAAVLLYRSGDAAAASGYAAKAASLGMPVSLQDARPAASRQSVPARRK